jgi:hypothetical protein
MLTREFASSVELSLNPSRRSDEVRAILLDTEMIGESEVVVIEEDRHAVHCAPKDPNSFAEDYRVAKGLALVYDGHFVPYGHFLGRHFLGRSTLKRIASCQERMDKIRKQALN